MCFIAGRIPLYQIFKRIVKIAFQIGKYQKSTEILIGLSGEIALLSPDFFSLVSQSKYQKSYRLERPDFLI